MVGFCVVKFVVKAVERSCWKSDNETDGCSPFEDIRAIEIRDKPKRDLRGRRKAGLGDSAQRHSRDAEEPLPDFSTGIIEDANIVRGPTPSPNVIKAFSRNGTVCVCDTDLCNEAGGRYLQSAGSAYFTVICALTLTALITLSAADDDQH